MSHPTERESSSGAQSSGAPSATRCGFAAPGTYGHECGAPATMVGERQSASTKSGIFYARRCEKCAAIKGGENTGLENWQAFDSAKHVNRWAA